MFCLAILTLIKTCILKREEKTTYLKNFKKVKVFVIYLISILLFWLGINYSGKSPGSSFLLSLKSCIEIIVFIFDYDSVELLMKDSSIYSISMYTLYILSILNMIYFLFSLFFERIYNYFRLKYIKINKKNLIVLISDNEQNRKIISTIDAKDYLVLYVCKRDNTIYNYSFINKLAYIGVPSYDNLPNYLIKILKSPKEKNISFILNTQNDEINLTYLHQMTSFLSKTDSKIKVYAFGDAENKDRFVKYAENSNGCIRYVDINKVIAMDFVNRFPLTEFMDERHIDYTDATIKMNVSLNVVLIGFNKLNQQIFLTSISNNQFITKEDGEIKEKKVNYWIYEKNSSRKDALDDNYYRFSKEIRNNTKDYLSLPSKPANEHFIEMDFNDDEFDNSLKEKINKSNTDYINYIIISLENDSINKDCAKKIIEMLKEWGINSSTKVFVQLSELNYTENNEYVSFGEMNRIYNIKHIISDSNEKIAINRKLLYDLNISQDSISKDDVEKKVINEWNSQTEIQRYSNIYACISIRMKLHLLGFDYISTTSNKEDASADFKAKYENADPIIYDESKPQLNGRKTIIYTNNYIHGSVRENLAIQEHQRWNAFMISYGMIPSTIAEIKQGKSKNPINKKHGNITSWEGLIKYRQIEAERREISEEITDVIRYDYQIMDDVDWLLRNSGYKIIKKEKHQ